MVGEVLHEGRTRALSLSTVAFTVCFAVWTIFSIIGIQIKQNLGLSETQFGLLVGTPILTGSLVRIVLGVWADRYGGHKILPLVMIAAGIATWALIWAETYTQFLLVALGVGLAGGSFAVGIAYVSRWYPASKQGTALGIFGAGNVGAAVTKFTAPFVMVAAGWEMVAQVWAVVIVVTGVLFFFLATDDPVVVEQRRKGITPRSAWLELEPLKNVQVWRFSLYYFFVFGAFVALALWLPRYLIGVYGLDIRTAGMIGALYSIPASIFRAYGGHLSDQYGARRIMYWTFGVSLLCCFLLSYPPTQYVVRGIDGPISFTLEMGLPAFIVLIFVLGFFMSLGKAAVYKHIPVYFPKNVGAVGGLVGMIGGLGGFLLPIAFGALNDLTGVWTSSFMLLFLIVAVSMIWMHVSVRSMERAATGTALEELSAFPELQDIHAQAQPEQVAAPSHVLSDWRPEDPAFWQASGRSIARRNLLISIPALLLSFSVWMVWSVIVAKLPLIGFAYTTDQLFWLAALPGSLGRHPAHLLQFHDPDFRWSHVDHAGDLVAADTGARHRFRGARSGHALCGLSGARAGLRTGWRQLCLVDVEHFVLLSQGREGTRAGAQRGAWQPRCQRRAVRGADDHHGRRVRSARWRAADRDPGRRNQPDLAAERGLHLGSVHHRLRVRSLVRHERCGLCQGILRRPGGDLPPRAQLDHVLALHRNLRLVHRLFRGLSIAGQDRSSPR